MKIKLTIIGKRAWEKNDTLSGERVACNFYQAFDEKGKPIEFKTDESVEFEHFETLKYLPEKAVEVDLKAVYDSFKGKMKFVQI